MLLPATTRLGPYEILAPIGQGGMGEVYRANDSRLGRQVALKVLPAATMSDPESRARFVREAQAASRLNHPNIVAVFDIGEDSGRMFVAMEYVAGKTLDACIPPGGLRLDEALKYAAPIAAALAAAHDAGIVHRDLKPGNVMVTSEGTVKILDFGLARILPTPGTLSESDATVSATGQIVGTPQYMAPEQAQGKHVDKRADIWAFGLILLEMLTGQHPFKRDTVADTLVAVLSVQPRWEQAPPKMRRLLRRCLEKSPQQRLRDIGDAWDLIAPNDDLAARPKSGTAIWIAIGAAVVLASFAGFWWTRRVSRLSEPLTRLSVDLGPDAMRGFNDTAVISPDGRRLAFLMRGTDGKPQLATRLLDQAQPTLLPGTVDGSDPFFSPDSQWIGFFANGKLMKIPASGGAPVVLSPSPDPRGASWGESGGIVAALRALTPLDRIAENGGTPHPITKLATGEGGHRWPQVLPGGAVLFTATAFNIGSENAHIEVLPANGPIRILPITGYCARYVPTGHLLYIHRGTLYGVRFDLAALEVRGSPVPLIDDISSNLLTGGGQFSFSEQPATHGTLVYLAGKASSVQWRLMWLDNTGKIEPLKAPPGAYTNPRFSPDGKKLALMNGTDIYIHDLERETTTLLTTGQVTLPIWMPDGKHLIFLSGSEGHNIAYIRSDGAGEPLRLFHSQDFLAPWSVSPDGKRIAFYMTGPGTDNDLWTLPLDLRDPEHPKPGTPELFLGTPAPEGTPRFSPDGRWIAYGANDSGTNEVYVRPFPAGSPGRWQVSIGGGWYPAWSSNGHELFYEAPGNHIMVEDYTVKDGAFVPGKPRLWVQRSIPGVGGMPNMDLAPEGRRMLIFEPLEQSTEPVHVTMWFNFFDELRRRIP